MSENWTVLKVVNWTRDYLHGKGVDNPRLDAELLIGSALKKDRVGLYLCYDQPLQQDELQQIHQLVARRAQREPVQYILGYTEFWSLRFNVNPAVLIPRADTEVLVEEALRLLQTDQLNSGSQADGGQDVGTVLDIGTGSGAIAVAIAHEISSNGGKIAVDAIDISDHALTIAKGNAELNGVAERINFYQHDMADLGGFIADGRIDGQIDGSSVGHAEGYRLIVSNPPYISSAEMAQLMPEVAQHEPHLALAGGSDGLDFYRQLCSQAMAALQLRGWLVVEVGATQAQEVQQLMEQAGLSETFSRDDYSGITRVVGARKPSED